MQIWPPTKWKLDKSTDHEAPFFTNPMKPSVHFRLPASFQPGEFLQSPRLIRLGDDARYFMSLILTKTARGQVDEFGNVRLMAKHLRNIMHKHHYNHVVDALLDRGAVQRVPYQVGKRSFGFLIAASIWNSMPRGEDAMESCPICTDKLED